MSGNDDAPSGLIPGIVRPFLSGRPAIILLIVALCLGVAAVMITPREEDPQIVVPLADIYVKAPGATPKEVEKLVATPLERLLWQVDGVEYVYSMSHKGQAIVTVRFYVGEDREDSLVKLHNQITMHIDQVPEIVQGWVIKPVEIDDVPIVNLTLYSERYNDHELRRISEEVCWRLSRLEDISRSFITGGRQREVRVELKPERMNGYTPRSFRSEKPCRARMPLSPQETSTGSTGTSRSTPTPFSGPGRRWPVWWWACIRAAPSICGILPISATGRRKRRAIQIGRAHV